MKANQRLKTLLSFSLLFISLSATCQHETRDTIPLRKRHYDYDKIFSTNHTNFVLRVSILPGRNIRLGSTGVNLHIKTQTGYEIGWMYQFNFIKRWGLQIGLRGEADNEYFNVYLPKNYTGFFQDFNNPYIRLGLVSVILPVYACYYIPFNDKRQSWLANFKMGVDFKYGSSLGELPTWIYTGPTGQQNIDMVDMTIHKTIQSNFFASFHASAGINYILPNKRMLNLQVIGNWSPIYRNRFDYSLMPGAKQEIDGSFIHNYSSIGFEINYILTNPYHMGKKRRRLDKKNDINF
jgi:hypothetical protein